VTRGEDTARQSRWMRRYGRRGLVLSEFSSLARWQSLGNRVGEEVFSFKFHDAAGAVIQECAPYRVWSHTRETQYLSSKATLWLCCRLVVLDFRRIKATRQEETSKSEILMRSPRKFSRGEGASRACQYRDSMFSRRFSCSCYVTDIPKMPAMNAP
jgi:hypothetical protein